MYAHCLGACLTAPPPQLQLVGGRLLIGLGAMGECNEQICCCKADNNAPNCCPTVSHLHYNRLQFIFCAFLAPLGMLKKLHDSIHHCQYCVGRLTLGSSSLSCIVRMAIALPWLFTMVPLIGMSQGACMGCMVASHCICHQNIIWLLVRGAISFAWHRRSTGSCS